METTGIRKESGMDISAGWRAAVVAEKTLVPCHFSTLPQPERAPVVQKLWTVLKNVIGNV